MRRVHQNPSAVRSCRELRRRQQPSSTAAETPTSTRTSDASTLWSDPHSITTWPWAGQEHGGLPLPRHTALPRSSVNRAPRLVHAEQLAKPGLCANVDPVGRRQGRAELVSWRPRGGCESAQRDRLARVSSADPSAATAPLSCIKATPKYVKRGRCSTFLIVGVRTPADAERPSQGAARDTESLGVMRPTSIPSWPWSGRPRSRRSVPVLREGMGRQGAGHFRVSARIGPQPVRVTFGSWRGRMRRTRPRWVHQSAELSTLSLSARVLAVFQPYNGLCRARARHLAQDLARPPLRSRPTDGAPSTAYAVDSRLPVCGTCELCASRQCFNCAARADLWRPADCCTAIRC